MSELDLYWQKGGTYIIPVEVINQLTGEFEDKDKEIERLNNIIKEVREYITFWYYRNDFRVNSFTNDVRDDLLRILDKVDKEK